MQDSKKHPQMDVNTRKKNLTLDLQPTHNFNTRRSKLEAHKNSSAVLSSPDLQKLHLKTPELENLIIQQNSLTDATPTPNTTQILFPKAVTEEQERYARGFEDALQELHCSDSSQGGNQPLDISNSNSNNSIPTYTELDPQQVSNFLPITSTYNSLSPLGVVIKDEPQTVPNMSDSPNLSPIDMENQEIIKLERKRMRNRVAASKCRRRKLERIAKLEEKVKLLKGENNDLSAFVVKLKDQVCQLKGQVLDHVNSGCQIMNYC
ncbi:hypothetical protein RUM43_014572 [Polyplax serrata]|uniref:BZIP domain-containing protein n=1 Tax=Polyplax serrata TaxID=468196 RepID=A0AAN8PQR5_POLSC